MATITCASCQTRNGSDARFCFKCGQPLASALTPESVDSTQSCWQCRAELTTRFRFCGNCGADTELADDETSEESLGDDVVAALEAVLGLQGTVVLVKRPGTKRPRRCQVATGISPDTPGGGWDTFSVLLEETLRWDGFLFGEVANFGPQYVWHVLDGRIFPLGAEHAAAALLYLEDLQPYGWSEVQLFRVLDAPSLET